MTTEARLLALEAENARLQKRVARLESAAQGSPANGKPVNRKAYEAAMDAWVYQNDRRPFEEYRKRYAIP